jgi:pantoate--beta-alanine ligase
MFDQLPPLRSPSQLRSRVRSWRAFGEKVALVPVFGAVHDGHAALLRAAREDGRRVAACLVEFRGGCLPRDIEADADRLDAEGADVVCIVPAAAAAEAPRTRLVLGGLTDILCGRVAPGCFDATVLTLVRLVNQTQPDSIHLSDVQWQLCVILSQLAGDLDLATEVRIAPAVRTADGLAASAAAARLGAAERRLAARFPAALRSVVCEVKAGAAPEAACRGAAEALIAAGFEAVDYLEVRHAGTLARICDLGLSGPARVFGSVRLGGARLIDGVAVA